MTEHYPPFPLSLITPESVYFSGETTMVEVPGTEGDFGVLKGHMPFISTLRPGIVTIHEGDAGENAPGLAGGGRVKKIFVTGGLAEANPQSCTILAERVEDISKLTSTEAAERLSKAKAAFENTFDDDAKPVAEAELRVAEALVAILAH